MPENRILVVDDDPGICNMLEVILNGDGYEVSSAQSGARALRLVEKIVFPVIDIVVVCVPSWLKLITVS